MKQKCRCFGMLSALVMTCSSAMAAGTLTPAGSGQKPAEILSHDVRVVINNGFAMTEVTQRFRNPNAETVEAVYAFPVPSSASLSEVSVQIGERTINGEVLAKEEAKQVYDEEKERGNSAALAGKQAFYDFRFSVANLKPQEEALVRFVYYQPLAADTGVVRYVYPLEEGNTRDAAAADFWSGSSRVETKATLRMTVKSAWPLTSVRTPNLRPLSEKLALADGAAELEYELGSELGRDFVFYYQLAELPGRLEVVPYRAAGKPGTFMMVLTPGTDLRRLDCGADYIFVLDVSGSMHGDKLRTLSDGVAQSIGSMRGNDRFRIVTFNQQSREVTRGWVAASPDGIREWTRRVSELKANGSTNLEAGIRTALGGIDADRVTSLILVTDAVTNTGEVRPEEFAKLMRQKDIRVFGFLMGNSANWPLMRTICDASGGFYAGVSNSDDIIGQIALAKEKVIYEALHDVKLSLSGVKTFDVNHAGAKKLYRGRQLVAFGRYAAGGEAEFTMTAKISGREETYRCRVRLPDVDEDNPELERLWALDRIELFEDLKNSGVLPADEAEPVIRQLGIDYQLVTDETSMAVLSDEAFRAYGIERRNAVRTAAEHRAQSRRSQEPVKNYRVDIPAAGNPPLDCRSNGGENNLFKLSAPRLGGGAIAPVPALFVIVLGVAGCIALCSRR